MDQQAVLLRELCASAQASCLLPLAAAETQTLAQAGRWLPRGTASVWHRPANPDTCLAVGVREADRAGGDALLKELVMGQVLLMACMMLVTADYTEFALCVHAGCSDRQTCDIPDAAS